GRPDAHARSAAAVHERRSRLVQTRGRRVGCGRGDAGPSAERRRGSAGSSDHDGVSERGGEEEGRTGGTGGNGQERQDGDEMNLVILLAALVTTPLVPTVTGPVTQPGMMYPNPPVSVVPTAVKVEDFPYVTEEFFISGNAAGAPYTTRVVIRRPANAKQFSGTVVGEAMHAGGR